MDDILSLPGTSDTAKGKGKKPRRSKVTSDPIALSDDDNVALDDPLIAEPPKGRNKRGSKKSMFKSPQAGEKRPAPTSPEKNKAPTSAPDTTIPTRNKRARKEVSSPSKDKGTNKPKGKKGKGLQASMNGDSDSSLVQATGSLTVSDPTATCPPVAADPVVVAPPILVPHPVTAPLAFSPSPATDQTTGDENTRPSTVRPTDTILAALQQPGGENDPYEDEECAMKSLQPVTRGSSPLSELSASQQDITMAPPPAATAPTSNRRSNRKLAPNAAEPTQGSSNSPAGSQNNRKEKPMAGHSGSLAANKDGSGMGRRGRRPKRG